jgi:hypothetical protein
MAADDTKSAFVRELESTMGLRAQEPTGITQPFLETRDDSSDFSEPDALVGARLKPRPPLNSGAIELPLPKEPDFKASTYSAFEIALSAVR